SPPCGPTGSSERGRRGTGSGLPLARRRARGRRGGGDGRPAPRPRAEAGVRGAPAPRRPARLAHAGRAAARRVAGDARGSGAGGRAGHTPAVLPLDAGLETRLEAWPASDPWPQRLGAQASAVLWERCLERAAGLDRVDAAAFVPAARRAWRRLAEWNVDVDALARAAVTGDERRFARAAREYGRALAANGWLDAAGVAALVAAGLDAG